jgi:excinuclease UvrABC ATPase subunit
MVTRTEAQSPALHVADRRGLIRVHGARVNNLKDVSVELPKRRLTVFTGVSGSGQEPAGVRHHRRGVAAADQRDLQRLRAGLHADAVAAGGGRTGWPDDRDHRRPGADGRNPRSTVGTATDANAMLRILFSRLGKPHIGPPTAFSFNVPTRTASGAVTVDKGKGERIVVRNAVYQGGMCPHCEGMGSVNDFDLSQLYDDTKSLSEGALTIPGYSMDGWYGRIFSGSGYFDMDMPIKKFTKKELHDLLYKEPTKIKVEGST